MKQIKFFTFSSENDDFVQFQQEINDYIREIPAKHVDFKMSQSTDNRVVDLTVMVIITK